MCEKEIHQRVRMKVTASVFSWLGGFIGTLVEFICLLQYYNYNIYFYYNFDWIWIVFTIVVLFRLLILIWREIAVKAGNKVGCGVCTLLFASIIGGILTLCIPDSELQPSYYTYSASHSNRYSSTYGTNSNSFSSQSQNTKIEIYKSLLNKGTISIEEFVQKLRSIGVANYQDYLPQRYNTDTNTTKDKQNGAAKTLKENKALTEFEVVELLGKYKNMLDNNIITQEEFENKKKELLG